MIITYKYRIKDRSCRNQLLRYARDVNFVWNYCCEVQKKAESFGRKWPTHFDLVKLTIGTKGLLTIGSDTVGEVCRQFTISRNTCGKCPRFRSRIKSLGWVPTRGRTISADSGAFIYYGKRFRIWDSRDIEGVIKTASIIQDARGRWYVCFNCEVEEMPPKGNGAVGIDLGLKALATLSTGETIPAMQHYRKYETALSKAQRSGNKKRTRSIHAKIANSRRHHLHVESTKIARANSLIVVGNVKPSKLAKTRMAKSVLDAGWSSFRSMLRYKASRHGASYIEADERFTSQVCSSCGCNPSSSPKGIGALGIRHWICSDCGSSHDRDVNAAKNILRVGLECQPRADGIAA